MGMLWLRGARFGVAGAALLAACLWTAAAWAGGDALQVRRVSPSGKDVTPSQEAVIQFDRKMVPLGHMGRDTATLPVSISPAPGCQWRWLNTSELACRLPGQQTFAPATHYTITIGTALKALDGSHLDKPVVKTFTTRRPKVDRTHFQRWRSPVMPVLMVRLNLPVTRQQLAGHLFFSSNDGDRVPVKVEPFTDKRRGPIWLPVPGKPGAVVIIDHPSPDTPLDAHAAAAQGRRVWQVEPIKPLHAGTEYDLRVRQGLHTPLGPLQGLPGDASVASVATYGDFRFKGIRCDDNEGDDFEVDAGDASSSRCRPGSVEMRFSAPVPRATLAAMTWKPLPESAAHMARIWKNYPQWHLRVRNGAHDARGSDSYPLSFKLGAMQDYTVTVPAGVKDRFGRTLEAPMSVTFRTGHLLPFIDLPPGESVLEVDQPTIAPLRFTNLDKFTFSYQRLTASELAHGFIDAGTQHVDLLQRPDLAAPRDQIVRGALGIRAPLDGYSGVVWGTLRWNGRWDDRDRPFMGIVTPWQVYAKVGHYNTLVWINRWDNGAPVVGAQVKMVDGPRYDLSGLRTEGHTATTNADGLAVLPGTVDLPTRWFNQWKTKTRFYIGATHAGAMALLPLDYSFHRSVGSASHYDVWESNEPPHGHMRAWAVTEQGIYKPGSDIKFALFVRAEGGTTLKAPPALDYTLTVTDPQGKEMLKREHLKLSDFGGWNGQLQVPTTASMGWYDITVTWPVGDGQASRQAGRFLVTDFVPASFKVHAQVEGEQFHPGDKVVTQVHATLHAGGPYTKADTKVTTRLVPEWFSPDTAATSGFTFGGDEDLPDAKTLAITKRVLDDKGRTQVSVTLPSRGNVVYGEVKVEAAVESARATWVANDASVPYAARDRFVGLRTEDWMQVAEKPFKVAYVVVDPMGKPEAGGKIALELQRKTIARVKIKNGAGEFTGEEQVKWVTDDTCKGVSIAAPGHCLLTPTKAGRYRVTASVVDTHGRTQHSIMHTWVTGAGGVVWSRSGEGVTLVPDQSSYHVGDTAHVLVQNPYPGARALVTVERYGVLWKKVVTLKGSAPVIDVPIKADSFPGAYLSVTIFSPRAAPPADPDLGRPEVALGYVPLKVVGKGSSLDVDVTPAKSQYKPRQSVDVNVSVKTHDGKTPGKTRLLVAVVDQGVLDLLQGGTDYYDPRKTFYAPPDGPDIANYSLAEQLLTRLQPKVGKGKNPGGGGGASSGPNVRSNFKFAAYWNPQLQTDASGHAHFSFKVPDNLTRWRILVIAMRPAAAMGLGIGSVRVNLPLQIKPALPNQMHVGDRFGAAFNVTNRTQAQRHVTTQVAAHGAIKDGKATASHAFDLDAFGHALSWLPLEAVAPGDIVLTGTARSGTLSDAVKATIPVTRAGTEVVAAEYGSTTDAQAAVPVKVPATAIPGTSKVEVTFAPTLVGGLDGAFDVMYDNPLRTWEVRLSRGVLASDYLRLKPVLGDSVDWPGASDEVTAMLQSAAAFQASSGGMAFWIPREDFVSAYLSVYTALAFDWLQDAGHTPPANVRSKLNQYLHDEILDKKGDKAAALVLRAGAMAALAQAPDGNLSSGVVAAMLPNLHKLRLFGQALLLDAAIATDDRDSADQIARSLLNHAEESAGEISFNEHREGTYLDLLSTPLRSNCAILGALSRYHATWGNENLVGSVPQKLMRWIAAQRKQSGAWPNSQENVFCTTATTHYADAYEKPVKALVGTLRLPGQAPTQASFASRADAAVQLHGRVTEPGQQFQVKLGRSGQGRLYYSVQLHYAMQPDALPAADAGMTLSRHYYVQRDGQWQPVTTDTVLKRGQIVRVALDVDAPTTRHHVVLTDPLPGAFQAVNRLLATSAKTTPAKGDGVAVLMFDGGAWPNMSIVTGGFYHRETGFEAVRFFADNLPAGHYRLVYAAQVIAPGSFIAPTPTIKEIYQPDVFGRGVSQRLNVAMPEP